VFAIGVAVAVGVAVAIGVRVGRDVFDLQGAGVELDWRRLLGNNRSRGSHCDFDRFSGRRRIGLSDLAGLRCFRALTRDDRPAVRIDQSHRDRRQAHRFPVAGPGKNYVLHAGAAQDFRGLFAEHPTDGVAEVRFSAAIWSHDSRHAAPRKAHLRTVAERLKPLNFNTLKYQQRRFPLNGMPMVPARSIRYIGRTAARGSVTSQ
jgi:hypothetical protein